MKSKIMSIFNSEKMYTNDLIVKTIKTISKYPKHLKKNIK